MESQILDYPLHQRRLLPLMAQAIAMGFTALRYVTIYYRVFLENQTC